MAPSRERETGFGRRLWIGSPEFVPRNGCGTRAVDGLLWITGTAGSSDRVGTEPPAGPDLRVWSRRSPQRGSAFGPGVDGGSRRVWAHGFGSDEKVSAVERPSGRASAA